MHHFKACMTMNHDFGLFFSKIRPFSVLEFQKLKLNVAPETLNLQRYDKVKLG